MEERPAPSDLEVNQEKLLIIKDEYRRLCFEMKKKEQTRNSSHAKMQQHIRQQWETISELKKQKSELTLQLRLQESESFTNQVNQNLEQFKKLLDDSVKLEGHITEQNQELEKCIRDISELEKKLRLKQKEVVKAQRCKGRVLNYQKNISFLENRLNGSLNKYSQLLISNNALREDINSLLLTQSAFRRKFRNIKRLLALGKKTLSEVVHSATVSYQTGESVKYKLNVLKQRTHVDQKKLGEKIKELKILVEQDKQLKEFLDFKMKDRSTSSETEESSKNEQIMEQRLQWSHGILARIHLASNCKDVNHICKAYIQGEELNLNLFEKVNEMSLEIEQLHEEVRMKRQELEEITQQYKEQKRKDLAVKHDIENTTDKLRTEAQQLEDATDLKVEQLESVKDVLKRIYTSLDKVSLQQVSYTVDEGISDDNVMQYLEALERRVMDLVRCDKFVEMKHCKINNTLKLCHEPSNIKNLTEKRAFPSVITRKKSKSVTCTMYKEEEDNSFNIPYNAQHLEAFARMYREKLHCNPSHT